MESKQSETEWEPKTIIKYSCSKKMIEIGRFVSDTRNSIVNPRNRIVYSFSTNTKTAEKGDINAESLGICQNVGIISFAFMLLFAAFQSMANLQSSINHEVMRLFITDIISSSK